MLCFIVFEQRITHTHRGPTHNSDLIVNATASAAAVTSCAIFLRLLHCSHTLWLSLAPVENVHCVVLARNLLLLHFLKIFCKYVSSSQPMYIEAYIYIFIYIYVCIYFDLYIYFWWLVYFAIFMLPFVNPLETYMNN